MNGAVRLVAMTFVPLLERKFSEGAATLNACVVDQDVDVAVVGFDCRDAPADRGGVGDVEHRRRRVQVLVLQFVRGGVEQRLRATIEHDMGTRAR